MSAYTSHAGPPELPELEYQLLRALCAAAGPRSIEELADTIGRAPGGIRATVHRLTGDGYAQEHSAWILSRTGRAALTDRAVRRPLTEPQQAVLRALDATDGARTAEELASMLSHVSDVSETIRSLSTAIYVRPVPAFAPTGRAHRALSGLVTMRLLEHKKNGNCLPG
ncbi:hypothetical protein [Nocardia wallacei]|uniref:hypothetical protein n=1 Tax=Nocardia wallacei TaxID=480035 RepID=UPI0024565329|nr:hypothetical protein [Nocardia wallacei]